MDSQMRVTQAQGYRTIEGTYGLSGVKEYLFTRSDGRVGFVHVHPDGSAKILLPSPLALAQVENDMPAVDAFKRIKELMLERA